MPTTATFKLWSGVLEMGGYDVIVEPFTEEELQRAVTRAAQSFVERCSRETMNEMTLRSDLIGRAMFRKIVVAYNESPESQRAFVAAIKLAKSLNAELLAVTAIGELPAYTAFAAVADSSISRVLEEDRRDFYAKLQDHARAQVESYGIGFHSHLVEGRRG